MADQPALARRLNTTDAVVIGLGSMIGAGVFAAFGPAARAAGTGLLIGLALAAAIAYCNASSSAQLAAVYPTSGGTYIYGRERLGPWWGFIAGWGFVIGKTASCAAMALTVAGYAAPGAAVWVQRTVGVAAVVLLTILNYRGVTKTAVLARILLACSLIALAAVVVGISASAPKTSHISGFTGTIYVVLQSAGLLFFAFAGYARIATMGEEVRDPARTIPRAITVALAIAVAIYLVVGVAALLAAGPDRLANAAAPLVAAVRAGGAPPALESVISVGAVLASLGALLALIAGLSRTVLAMARYRDLPGWLAAVHPRHRVPHHAKIAIGVVVCGLVSAVDLRAVIGFSSFGVLVYYAIANAAAYTMRRRRVISVCGLVGCLVLVATLPWESAIAGLAVFAVGIAGRATTVRRRL
ncbi:APC family permease [Mycobacterium montefiorense]|uniref:Transporter n=1 Tax=Mycobacterium montefiorense TaxID=154654 RepID=A0AA37UY13_9MYCO|nr:APC family permease [Mycobacterium montefiorense]GBG40630.1 putative transporter [Mycobacterium montefiorense]GKU33389.1 putative transporter [Mycobacterium montefiorense]GKU41683.1 putative transporter [Mycobacterium montefiorense]GKU44813.1 putative transporter [Mycobacterium montefiorense]GKU52107.1 putative transporter [Mycobacterium montefiorense]